MVFLAFRDAQNSRLNTKQSLDSGFARFHSVEVKSSNKHSDVAQRTMRQAGLVEKILCRLRSPLASVPECKDQTRMAESIRHGWNAHSYRIIADNLVSAVEYVVFATVLGDIAEFGVQTGRTSRAISAAMKMARANKHLHLFDSFEGLPASTDKADIENAHVKEGAWEKGALVAISPAELRKICGKYIANDSIHIYEGWFCNTLKNLPKGVGFSMVHIDCDLYSSALDVLDYLFKTGAINKGAIILFDDWQCNQASNDHGERKAWREVTAKYRVEVENIGSYGWAGQKFLVHGYSSASV
jgi:hypothetical protein